MPSELLRAQAPSLARISEGRRAADRQAKASGPKAAANPASA